MNKSERQQVATTTNAAAFLEHVSRLRGRERAWGRCHGVVKTACYGAATVAALVVSLNALFALPSPIPQVAAILAPGLLALGGFFARLQQWREDTAVQLENVLRLFTYKDGGAEASEEDLLNRIDWVNIIMSSAVKTRPDYKQLEELAGHKR